MPTKTPTDEELAAWRHLCSLKMLDWRHERLIAALQAVKMDLARVTQERHEARRERDEAKTKLLVYETDANASYMAGKSFMRGQLEPALQRERDRAEAALAREREKVWRLVEALEAYMKDVCGMGRYSGHSCRLCKPARDALAAVREET